MGAFDHLKWSYDGAFEELFGPGREEFEQKFNKNSNARGVAQEGMLKLRFDWYISQHAGFSEQQQGFLFQTNVVLRHKSSPQAHAKLVYYTLTFVTLV